MQRVSAVFSVVACVSAFNRKHAQLEEVIPVQPTLGARHSSPTATPASGTQRPSRTVSPPTPWAAAPFDKLGAYNGPFTLITCTYCSACTRILKHTCSGDYGRSLCSETAEQLHEACAALNAAKISIRVLVDQLCYSPFLAANYLDGVAEPGQVRALPHASRPPHDTL